MDAGQRGGRSSRVSFAVAGTGTEMCKWGSQGHGEERVLHLLRIQGVGVT